MASFRLGVLLGAMRTTTSRRAAAAAILGALPGLGLAADPERGAANGKRSRRKRNKRKNAKPPCRPGSKEGKNCRCATEGATCTNDAQCCPKAK